LLPSTAQGVNFSPSGNDIAAAHNLSPFISAYPWTSGVGFGTKYANPTALPSSTGLYVAFSPSGIDIAVAHANSPFVTAYPFAHGVGFGAKYADPSTLPTGTGNGVAFFGVNRPALIPISSMKIWTDTIIGSTVSLPAITGISVGE